jgi:hypothetical protein
MKTSKTPPTGWSNAMRRAGTECDNHKLPVRLCLCCFSIKRGQRFIYRVDTSSEQRFREYEF